MPEKVTSLNGLKVTLEYGSYTASTLNAFYVKYQLFTYTTPGSQKKNHKIPFQAP